MPIDSDFPETMQLVCFAETKNNTPAITNKQATKEKKQNIGQIFRLVNRNKSCFIVLYELNFLWCGDTKVIRVRVVTLHEFTLMRSRGVDVTISSVSNVL